jgi:hypothetical protein
VLRSWPRGLTELAADRGAAGAVGPGQAGGARTIVGVRSRVTVVIAAFASSAVLGAIAGVIWAAVAPRATLQEIGQGSAQLVNAETSAFIAADGWFCLISVVAGLLTGVAGYWLAVRRTGTLAAVALIAGALAGSLIMLWVGENIGLSTYNHQLATAANGTFFNASLGLGAKSALAFWPLATAGFVALGELGSRKEEPPGGVAPYGGYAAPGQGVHDVDG